MLSRKARRRSAITRRVVVQTILGRWTKEQDFNMPILLGWLGVDPNDRRGYTRVYNIITGMRREINEMWVDYVRHAAEDDPDIVEAIRNADADKVTDLWGKFLKYCNERGLLYLYAHPEDGMFCQPESIPDKELIDIQRLVRKVKGLETVQTDMARKGERLPSGQPVSLMLEETRKAARKYLPERTSDEDSEGS